MGLLALLFGYILRDAASGPKPVSKEDGQALEDSFDKRERAPGKAQLAGKKCKACKETIVAQPDGQRCPTCRKAIHKGCVEAHLRTCGAPATPPYR